MIGEGPGCAPSALLQIMQCPGIKTKKRKGQHENEKASGQYSQTTQDYNSWILCQDFCIPEKILSHLSLHGFSSSVTHFQSTLCLHPYTIHTQCTTVVSNSRVDRVFHFAVWLWESKLSYFHGSDYQVRGSEEAISIEIILVHYGVHTVLEYFV